MLSGLYGVPDVLWETLQSDEMRAKVGAAGVKVQGKQRVPRQRAGMASIAQGIGEQEALAVVRQVLHGSEFGVAGPQREIRIALLERRVGWSPDNVRRVRQFGGNQGRVAADEKGDQVGVGPQGILRRGQAYPAHGAEVGHESLALQGLGAGKNLEWDAALLYGAQQADGRVRVCFKTG